MNGLPGIEVLFREHKRLSSKLTKDEMRAMRQYLDNRLLCEQNEMLFQINTLRTNYDADRHEMEDTITRLKKELEFKTELMDQYKSTDTNLANVHKQREERLEQKYNDMTSDLQRCQTEVVRTNNQLNEAKRELAEKARMINEQRREIETLGAAQAKVRRAEELISTNEHVKQDLLRLKLEADAKEKEIQKLRGEINPLIEELYQLKGKLKEEDERNDNLEKENRKLTREIQAKNENLAISKYHLDAEKRRCKALEKQIEEFRNLPEQKPAMVNNDSERVRNEVLKIHQQHLESRVKILEEKVAMYRLHCRNISQEITTVSDEISKTNTLKDRLVVHGNTQVEKLIVEVLESMTERRSALENMLHDLNRQIPSIIPKDASSVKGDVMAVKKQAELHKVNEVVLKTTRLLQRIEACEKAKFVYTASKERKVSEAVHVKTQARPREQNLTLKLAARAGKTEHVPYIANSADGQMTSEKFFTTVKPSTPGTPLLSRPKQTNGPPVTTTWRKRPSLTSEFSPTLIDLTLSPAPSPSPREKTKSFFTSASTSSLPNGFRELRKSFSEQGEQ